MKGKCSAVCFCVSGWFLRFFFFFVLLQKTNDDGRTISKPGQQGQDGGKGQKMKEKNRNKDNKENFTVKDVVTKTD